MIAVIAAGPEKTIRRMFVLRSAAPCEFEIMPVGPARLLKATVFLPAAARARKKAFAAAAKRLYAEGIRRAVLPEDCPWEELFRAQGISAVSDEGLYPKIASRMALFAGESVTGKEEHRLSVAVYADRQSADVRRAVMELGRRVKLLKLLGKANDRAVKSALMREFGVSAIGESPAEAGDIDVLLLFNLPDGGLLDQNPSRITVNLSGKDTGRLSEIKTAELGLPQTLSGHIPKELMSNRLVAAVLESGGVSAQQLRIVGPDRGSGGRLP